jgi:hypothetical protein
VTTVHKLIADVFPWATDKEVSFTVRALAWWSLFATSVLMAAPRAVGWMQAITVTIHTGMLVCVYFFLYDAGEWRGRRAVKSKHPPQILVPWEDAAIVEDVTGVLRVLLVPADGNLFLERGSTVRWRGKLPSRELREVDRFTTDLVTRKPWETRQ